MFCVFKFFVVFKDLLLWFALPGHCVLGLLKIGTETSQSQMREIGDRNEKKKICTDLLTLPTWSLSILSQCDMEKIRSEIKNSCATGL